MERINLVKKIIYDKLHPEMVKNNYGIYYGYAREPQENLYLIVSMLPFVDYDYVSPETIEQEKVDFQIEVWSNTERETTSSSVLTDNVMNEVKRTLKLQDLAITDNSKTYKLVCLLPYITIPAKFHPGSQSWVAVIRFRAIFTQGE